MKVEIGKSTLGGGKKMTAEIANYERSTHNLSSIFRNTQSVGTLVPFYLQPAQPEDTWDIELNCEVLTHPTVGPLFGSMKVQLDIFTADMRLYNAQLHNNELNIGLKMEQVKFPMLELSSNVVKPEDDNAQMNPSCIFKYLGISGLGVSNEGGPIVRQFNAMPWIAYWDIFKNYYANRQEDYAYVIHTEPIIPSMTITQIRLYDFIGGEEILPQQPDTETALIPWIGGQITYTAHTPTEQEVRNTILIKDDGTRITIGQIAQTINIAPNYAAFSNNNIPINIAIVSWDYPNENDIPIAPPTLVPFGLENIDNMRTKILQQPNTDPLVLSKDTLAAPDYPYILPLKYTAGRVPVIYPQEGLAVKTYQSDINNNWMNESWFTESGGINEIARVDVSDGYLSIDALAITKKVWTMLNRIALSGGSYNDWIETQYTNRRFRNAEIPIYRGGLSKELVFQEVISNAASEGQPLGQLAGRGVMSSKHKGGNITIKTDEHTWIMGIVSITPRIIYTQGNEWFNNLQTMADLHVPALDQIGYQSLNTETQAWWATRQSDGNTTYLSTGLQPAWLNYMTTVDKAYGNFAITNNEMFMILARRYDIINDPNDEFTQVGDLTTYIDPVKYNYIFAETSLDAMNYWVHISTKAIVRRKISAKVIPNL